jgi:hypothetical protein
MKKILFKAILFVTIALISAVITGKFKACESPHTGGDLFDKSIIAAHAPVAQTYGAKYGIEPSLLIGIALQTALYDESDFIQSNNCWFLLEAEEPWATPWRGEIATEGDLQDSLTIKYRKYPTLGSAYSDMCKSLKATGTTDYRKFLEVRGYDAAHIEKTYNLSELNQTK